jgi:hypothetical protein
MRLLLVANKLGAGIVSATCLLTASCGAPDVSQGEPIANVTQDISQSWPMHLPIDINEWWTVTQGNAGDVSHTGINEFAVDIARVSGSTFGAPVRAAISGTVAVANPPGGYLKINASGNCTMPLPTTPEASDCLQWVPIHMSSVTAQVGSTVQVGAQIGAAGDTGLDPGHTAHIHMALAHVWGPNPDVNYQTIPQTYVDYEVSNDSGVSWDAVANGLPSFGQRFRRMPTWADWTSVGGSIIGAPGVFTASTGTVLYARGLNDDLLWENGWTGSAWTGWSQNMSGTVASSPGVVRGSSDNSGVIAAQRTVNGVKSVWTKGRVINGWGSWTNQGGSISGDPAVAFFNGRFYILARGTNNHLLRKILNANYSLFQDWQDVSTFQILSSPATAATSSFLYVYARGAGDAVYQSVDSGSGFGTFASIGGETTSRPWVVAQSNGQEVRVFVRGKNDNRLWQRAWHGSFWTSWYPSGTDTNFVLSSSPTVIPLAIDRFQVFAQGPNSEVWHKWQWQ